MFTSKPTHTSESCIPTRNLLLGLGRAWMPRARTSLSCGESPEATADRDQMEAASLWRSLAPPPVNTGAVPWRFAGRGSPATQAQMGTFGWTGCLGLRAAEVSFDQVGLFRSNLLRLILEQGPPLVPTNRHHTRSIAGHLPKLLKQTELPRIG